MKLRIWHFIIILILANPQTGYTASAASFPDTFSHWGNGYIDWAVKEGLAQGYEDGSFRPDEPVTEAEFLALMLRAYGIVSQKDEQRADWKKSYYDHAYRLGWPVNFDNKRGGFRRGEAALLIASASNGRAFGENDAIQWLLDQGISRGRSTATIYGFEAGGGVTRAEALTFIYMMKEKVASPSPKTIPSAGTTLRGISLNDYVEELLFNLGAPGRIDASEYDYQWYVYPKDYSAFVMFGVRNDRIVAMFSNDAGSWRDADGVVVDKPLATVLPALPAGTAGNAKQADHYYDYRSDGVRHVLFLDGHENNRIAASLLQLDSLAARKASALGEKERTAMEQGLFDLVNAERAQRGIGVLKWDSLAGSAARAHSADMMKKNYFSHKSLSGKSPFDRMKAVGIKYTLAAENIAAGFPNSIFAHYMLLNSKTGHRETILNGKFGRLGTGVAFGGSYGIYYTQDYYTP
ncbi:S-layer homology domain-containing protein [Paenibacillus sp. LHD-117]|uniref:S-layer homology domain-containing protein n=1 Tax=Paenibacillus sp. LHD-117 TaxID=3071412 RepID=UPI0027E1BE76|nr:S-layer homology domain-containing protein [Paenibacillus sp. LHD-117]MDQ6419281.1 S-layer homology domain-containing protein [Paenibacillus sp. LHD-117]